MKSKNKKLFLSVVLAVFVFSFVFTFISLKVPSFDFESLNVEEVNAQTGIDPVQQALQQQMLVVEIKEEVTKKGKWLKDAWKWLREKVIVRTAKIAYKNALRNFLSQMAYRTATWLSESGPGQGPLFTTESWKEFSQGIVETTMVDSLETLASKNGFFEFNVCKPSELDFSLSIMYTKFRDFGYSAELHKPKCSWQDLKKNWTDFRTGIAKNFENDQAFFDSVKNAFKPKEQNVGIALKVRETITTKIKDKKTQQFLQRIEQQGLKSITEPITGKIKTPAKFVGFQAQTLPAKAPVAEETPTGDIVADAMGIFTNTLVSKLMKRWLSDATGGKERAESTQDLPFIPPQGGAGQIAQQQQFGGLAEVSYTSGQENILEYLASCPDINNPGPTDCVIPPDLITAIENKLTVREALDEGTLHGDWVIGWDKDTQPAFNSGYPYRSLVIMRAHRIIPVGWELAAWYAKQSGDVATLNMLVDCFEDDNPENADNPEYPADCKDLDLDYNPYYHLVDPNWVLKAPETFCNKKGVGYQTIGPPEWACTEDNVPETQAYEGGTLIDVDYHYCEADAINPDFPIKLITRDSEYCADWKSCLIEDDDGNCTGIRGYCLKERELWRFEGDSCPAQYASCETLTTPANEQFSYLTNTLTQCVDPTDAGCNWYALEQGISAPPTSTLEWLTAEADPRIYLNGQAGACEMDSVGCTKLGRMMPGANMVVNGDFEATNETLDFPGINWIDYNSGPSGNDCLMSIEETLGLTGSKAAAIEVTSNPILFCAVESSGRIPIDPRFTYILSGSIKSANGSTDVRADIGVWFYENIASGYISEHYNIIDNDTQISITPSTNWETFSGYIGDQTNAIGANVSIPSNANYLKIFAILNNSNNPTDTVYFDNIQLGIVESPVVQHNIPNFEYSTESYTIDYSQTPNPNHSQHLKLAPSYLNCDKYNNLLLQYDDEETCETASYYWRSDLGFCVEGGNELCEQYTTYCEEDEIGCLGYTPINGDPEVPAKTAPDDVCPAGCAGYDSYIELNSFFEEIECPMYSQSECSSYQGCVWDPSDGCIAQESQQLFIPQTAQSCPAQDAGCEQFTNLDELAKGGEGLEYFTYLRQCISPDNPNLGFYYTWEGSDTTGYQLKKWEFLKSNLDSFSYFYQGSATDEQGSALCTNIEIGTEECADANSFNLSDPQSPVVCSLQDIDNGDYDCRNFFDAQGNHFFRKQSYAVTASSNCHPYRRTATGKIYNADPTEGTSCSAASNNCREYKGNSGNNIRVVLSDDFESGTTGEWKDWANGYSPGITISNESVVQGGHSLRTYIDNDTVGYDLTGELTAGKQYLITFWGKKVYNPAYPLKEASSVLNATQIAQITFLNFETPLTNLWDYYELGPLELPATLSQYVYLNIDITGLDSYEGFYVDNIILKEFTDNFYAIRDSWQTPVACDNSFDNPFGTAECIGTAGQICTATQNGVEFSCFIETGDSSCLASGLRFNIGVQQGCQEYQDRNYNTHFLKKFSYICSDTAIGCEAYITTQNSTDYQAEHTYGTFVCDEVVGTINSSGDCSIRGQVICNVGSGDSCEYSSYPGTSPGNTIPNDEVVYAVNDPEKSCSPAMQGCRRLGQPELNMQIGNLTDPDYIVSSETVLLVNNPDDYDSTLCSPTGEFCTQYTDNDGQLSYYYDPMSLTGTAGATSKTCYYSESQDKWLISGLDTDCPNQVTDAVSSISYLPRDSDYNYEGWAGLCEAEHSGCTTYLDPNDPLIDKADECDANLVPQLSGECNSENGSYITIGSHEYCMVTINNLEHKVCEASTGNSCEYGATGWYCDLSAMASTQTGCCLGGQTPECDGEADEIKVCTVYQGNDRCYYNLQCTPYNYLKDTVSAEGCNGLVDKEKGCVLFNDTNQVTLDFSSESTPDNAPAVVCDPNRSILFNDNCDANTLLRVRKDRQCAEWLACGSSFIDPAGEELCLDLIRCSGVGQAGESCTNIIPSAQSVEDLTIDLITATNRADEFNSVRFLSGYSHVGAKWSSTIEVAGYYSPEDMMQIGNPITMLNGDMEIVDELDELPEYWEETLDNGSGYCEGEVSYQNPHSGWYSLKTIMDESALEWQAANPTVHMYCGAMNPVGDFYLIDPDQRYSLSWWVKSENGAQKTTMGFRWYDGEGNKCDDTPGIDYCNPETGSPVVGQYDYYSLLNYTAPDNWTRYTLTFGPVDDTTIDKEIPPQARKIKVWMTGPRTADNGQPGWLLYDDVVIEPALKLNEDAIVAKDCRLFSKDNSPACSYHDVIDYQGWNGYCLEPDPKAIYNPNPLEPKDTQTCLQWYPVDSLVGDSLVFNLEAIGYTGPEELYYCAQSKGLANLGKVISGQGALTSAYKIQSKIHLDTNQNRTDDNCKCSGDYAVGNDNIMACNLFSEGNVDEMNVPSNLKCYRSAAGEFVCYRNNNPNLEEVSSSNTDDDPACDEWADYSVCPDRWYSYTPSYTITSVDNGISLDEVEGIYIETVATYDGDSNCENAGGGVVSRDRLLEKRYDPATGETSFSTHWSGNQPTVPCGGFGGATGPGTITNENKWGIYVKFGDVNGTQKVKEIFFKGCQGDNGDRHHDYASGERLNLYYLLKEPCTTIVKAVSAGQEKTWLTRYDYGWATSSDNILGLNRQLPAGSPHPYWGIFGSINTDSDPTNALYTVGLDPSDNAGMPYSTANDTGIISTGSGRMCLSGVDNLGNPLVGNSCNSSDDCGDDILNPPSYKGICGGIGKYCFNDEDISTGELCSDTVPCSFECKAVGHTSEEPNSMEELYEPDVESAIIRVQQLYAQVFGIWTWDYENGVYEECLDPEYCNISGFDMDDLDRSEDFGDYPIISNIFIRNQLTGDIHLEVPGEEVDLVFNSNIPDNQLPIEELKINWHDGNTGYLPGPLTEKPAGATMPHNVTHTYTCSPDVTGTVCQSCSPGGTLVGNSCNYLAPTINLRDHWDWCVNGSILTGISCVADEGVSYGQFNESTGVYNVGVPSPYYIIVGP